MTVRYSNSRADLTLFAMHMVARNWIYWGGFLLFAACFVDFLWSVFGSRYPLKVVLTGIVLLIAVAAVAYLILAALVSTLLSLSHTRPSFFTDHLLTASDDGLLDDSAVGSCFLRWRGFVRIHRSGRAIYVLISGDWAHIIPRRAFEDDASYDRFYQMCRERIDASKAAEGGNR